MAEKRVSRAGFDWKFKDGDYVRVYEGLDPRYGRVYTQSAQALARMAGLAPGQTVVDLACGTGLSTAVFARAVGPGGRVIGQDVNPEMMAAARTRLAETGWTTLVLADLADFGQVAQELDLAGRVDAVLSSFSYFYMYDFHERLQEKVFQVLKPGGRLGFNVGTFLSPVEYQGRTYNTFTNIFDQTLDRLLRERGFSAGLDPTPPRPVPMFTQWDLSHPGTRGLRRNQGPTLAPAHERQPGL